MKEKLIGIAVATSVLLLGCNLSNDEIAHRNWKAMGKRFQNRDFISFQNKHTIISSDTLLFDGKAIAFVLHSRKGVWPDERCKIEIQDFKDNSVSEYVDY